MRYVFLLLVILQPSASSFGQAVSVSRDESEVRRISLVSDLQALDARAGQLEKPLAVAAAKAEIADAAWTLDRDWAKGLLLEAYELSLPTEEVKAKFRRVPVGALVARTAVDRARQDVRRRVLSVACRDAAFAEELVRLGAKELGRLEEGERLSELASHAAARGDSEAAAVYIRQAFEAEPTQFNIGKSIFDLAAQDRAAADAVIVQYIRQLNSVSLSYRDASLPRVLLMLNMFLHPSPVYVESGGRSIPPPGPAVVRAYVDYVLTLLARDEQRRPGSLKTWRPVLLSLWPEINKHAPELAARYREVEALSRRDGDEAWSPPQGGAAPSKREYEERTRRLAESDDPDAEAVGVLIDRGEFDGARKLLDKLKAVPQKAELVNKLDAKESLHLLKKGDLSGAQILAGRLTKASYILQAYPAIVERCVSNKDETCAASAVYRATAQLKQSDATPPSLPPGVPASALPGGTEFDPILSSLCKLAESVLPLGDALAFGILDEMVAAADVSRVDTEQGHAGFDPALFAKLAHRDGQRSRRAALSFKDGLRQIVSLASIYRSEAEELSAKRAARR